MKKVYLLLVSFVMIFSLAACGADDSSGNNVATGNGAMDNGEKAWTVKQATYTYPTGTKTICYTGELKDNSFIMSYLTERKAGEVNRDSMIIEYDANGITKLIEESQDFGKDVERGEEKILTYDEATSTLTRVGMEDGKESSKEIYVITWDSEGRIAKYDKTNYYYYYKDDGTLNEDETNEYKYTYTYNYGTDSFTITCDEVSNVSVDDERVDAIRRKVSTVPYDGKGDITTVTGYYKMDGTTPLHTGWGDKKTVNETVVSNWWGYEVSFVTNYSDGTSESRSGVEYTFDDEGKILKKVYETYKNGHISEESKITVTVEFTYDENGNLAKIAKDEDDMDITIEFEWMQIPAKLDGQIAMLYGAPHWSAAEYIDNFVSFNWEGRLTVRTYKLEDFLACVK